jgi:hypothetical protein
VHTRTPACGSAQVVFDTRGLEPGCDSFDRLSVLSDAGETEVPLRALAPNPRLRLQSGGASASSSGGTSTSGSVGLLEFGLVQAGSSQLRRLRLVNEGSRPADWRALVEG